MTVPNTHTNKATAPNGSLRWKLVGLAAAVLAIILFVVPSINLGMGMLIFFIGGIGLVIVGFTAFKGSTNTNVASGLGALAVFFAIVLIVENVTSASASSSSARGSTSKSAGDKGRVTTYGPEQACIDARNDPSKMMPSYCETPPGPIGPQPVPAPSGAPAYVAPRPPATASGNIRQQTSADRQRANLQHRCKNGMPAPGDKCPVAPKKTGTASNGGTKGSGSGSGSKPQPSGGSRASGDGGRSGRDVSNDVSDTISDLIGSDD